MAGITDFHTHIGKIGSAFYDEAGQKALEKTARDLLAEMKENRVSRSVVFAQPMIPSRQEEANQELLKDVRGKKELIPFAFVDPRLEETPALLRKLVKQGVRGVKVHPIAHGYVVSHSMCFPTLEFAEKKGLPVIVHSGWGAFGSVGYIAGVADHFPSLNIVVAHMVEKDVLEHVSKKDNLHMDTSFASSPRKIERAVKKVGPLKILFGSDYPYNSQHIELEKLKSAKLGKDEKELVLDGNSKRLLK